MTQGTTKIKLGYAIHITLVNKSIWQIYSSLSVLITYELPKAKIIQIYNLQGCITTTPQECFQYRRPKTTLINHMCNSDTEIELNGDLGTA